MANRSARSMPNAMPRNVLVVEDDVILSLALEDNLRDAGVEKVRVCTTTEDALNALREDMPDAVVIDVHLADRDDGWAIAELVSELSPNPPRVIFSTGSPGDIPEAILEAGPVLEKPYTPDDLVRLLRDPQKGGLLSAFKRVIR